MAYIIAEPIIHVKGADKGGSVIEVRFPVVETHTRHTHYRGVAIKLYAEELWMVGKDMDLPIIAPTVHLLGPNEYSEGIRSYAESLVKAAEYEEKFRELAERDGIDLSYPDKIKEWREKTSKEVYNIPDDPDGNSGA